MMGPMADFMGQGKSFAPVGTVLADGDNCGVVAADNARFAALKFAIADARTEMKGYRFKVDLAGLTDPQFLEQAFCRRETRHD